MTTVNVIMMTSIKQVGPRKNRDCRLVLVELAVRLQKLLLFYNKSAKKIL